MDITPDVFKRWKAMFLKAFPDFKGFGVAENDEFDRIERRYKTAKSDQLKQELERAREGGVSFKDAALSAVYPPGQGSLVRPQTLNSFRTLDWEGHPEYESAVRDLLNSDHLQRPSIVEAFVKLFSEPLAANGVTGAPEQARQIATCLLMFEYPNEAIYSRRTMLDQRYLEATGEPFPTSLPQREQYIAELSFANGLRIALRESGWEPRDLIDVQGFLWVVHDSAAGKAGNMSDNVEGNETGSRPPLNKILYGPPGTGKTFRTMEEAVLICDGKLPAIQDGQSQYDAIRQRYNELRERNRIEFITFHQSFSYEEFVEGLRPETGTAEADEDSAGFRLQAQDGVFRRIARLAGQAAKPKRKSSELEKTKAFKVSLGPIYDAAYSYVYDECLEGGYILLGHGGSIDWSGPQYEKWEAILHKWREVEPDATGNNPNVIQMYSMRSNMSIGDLVVVSNGNLKFRAIGRITGGYVFQTRADGFNHRRDVEWLWVADDEGLSHEDIYEKRFSMQSLYQLADKSLKWPAIQEIVSGPETAVEEEPPYVLIIDEINRGNISKIFGELITLLEPDKRLGRPHELRVRLPYSQEMFGVPKNLYVLGTMNTADRSISLLDTALRRRFSFQELMPQSELLEDGVDGVPLSQVLDTLNERIEYLFDRDHQIGHAYFMSCKSRWQIDEKMRESVIPLLVEYFYEDWEKVRAVLGETRDAGSFITRRSLKAPAGLGAYDATESRWRYFVNTEFPKEAYEQLTA